MNTFIFPFHSIDNNDLSTLFTDAASSAFYEHMYFNPYEAFDEHNAVEIPDNSIDCTVAYNRLLCNYHDVDEVNTLFSSLNNFTVIAHNIRSIPKNLEEFKTDFNIAGGYIDVLAFAETRLNTDIETIYNIPNYNMYSSCRNTMGGGVYMFLRDTAVVLLVNLQCLNLTLR